MYDPSWRTTSGVDPTPTLGTERGTGESEGLRPWRHCVTEESADGFRVCMKFREAFCLWRVQTGGSFWV